MTKKDKFNKITLQLMCIMSGKVIEDYLMNIQYLKENLNDNNGIMKASELIELGFTRNDIVQYRKTMLLSECIMDIKS